MLARCAPASTAMTELLRHSACGARTRRPVMLSSLGPPLEPCSAEYNQYCHAKGRDEIGMTMEQKRLVARYKNCCNRAQKEHEF